MSEVSLDTQGFVETLREAGVDKKQAVAHKNAICNASFTTKADIDRLRTGMRMEMREMEHRIKIDLVKWIVGIAFAQTALIVGVIGSLLNIL
uniref:DUF1640 domain-containing protein n=1 Tax=Candidatus Kentrum eta TaxID=2126337 RepID=A0A450URL5_9GAMM|nr:MAG: hypothetical protein BECKH772A_GA0070896_100834 [Candidatus Kentron sp. H]VFJ96028.1 MAG: hypothetical protein BECKH772B_GA0070898_100864 [Candidatus Kentron sp. H]VFK02116.1 MAG: hypothetical protein BECKH772C_GA0070978_100824 [Candidatus Kentron sp. H]